MSTFGHIKSQPAATAHGNGNAFSAGEPVFWRVEGSLLNLTAIRPVGFFAWNAQSFLGRWTRRTAVVALAIARPFFYAANRVFATRLLHAVLRGQTRDRLDLLGEEYFQYSLKPRLKPAGVAALKKVMASGARVVLVSQDLDHIMRPLAEYLGVEWIVSNRLDFRDGMATGRLLDPVIRPRGALARLRGDNPDGRVAREQLTVDLGFQKNPGVLDEAIRPVERPSPRVSGSRRAVRVAQRRSAAFGARDAAREKHTAHRGHRIHRQGVAREPANGPAGDWPDSPADSQPPHGDRARPLSAADRGVARIRRAGGTPRRRSCGFPADARRGGERRRKPAGSGPCAGSA